MSLRSSTLYIEPLTLRRLLLVNKLYPERVTDAGNMASREKTADERGNALLNEAIREKFPAVIELERELSKAEKDFIERMNEMPRKDYRPSKRPSIEHGEDYLPDES